MSFPLGRVAIYKMARTPYSHERDSNILPFSHLWIFRSFFSNLTIIHRDVKGCIARFLSVSERALRPSNLGSFIPQSEGALRVFPGVNGAGVASGQNRSFSVLSYYPAETLGCVARRDLMGAIRFLLASGDPCA